MNENLKITRDWENDGYIVIENAKTLDLYHKLIENERHIETNCFYAFDDEQFRRGVKTLKDKGLIRENEGLGRTRFGLFGYRDWLDDYFKKFENIEKEIAERCDMQEVYYYEWNNHECMYSDDSLAYEKVASIFGKDRASKLKRIAY